MQQAQRLAHTGVPETHAAWAYLAGRFGDAIVPVLYRAAAQSGDALGAIERITNDDLEALSQDWHRSVLRAYARPTQRAANGGRALITEDHEGGRLNLAPSLSPDGRWLGFLSERSLLDRHVPR